MARPSSFLVVLVAALAATALLSLSPVSAAICHPEDRKALLAIKQFWNNPYVLPSWVPSTNCCEWHGVACDPLTDRVIHLNISNDVNITGTIPPAVGDLTYLVILDIRKVPNLSGSIPSALTRLRNLISLRLEFNDLTGPVPAFLAQIPRLWYLNLGSNRLSGSIPGELAGLARLTYLALDHNQLTGPIPAELGKLPDETSLLLSHNHLSGPLPRSLGGVDFHAIDLSWNQLSGDAAFLFGRKKVHLTSIDLSRNMFEFDFGRVVFPIVSEVEFHTIKLNNNMIYGRIPKKIAQLGDLGTLDLSYNRLCGEIPTGVRMDLFNAEVYAHNSCLCGKPLSPCK